MIKIEELKNVKDYKDIDGLIVNEHASIEGTVYAVKTLVDSLVEENENGLYEYDRSAMFISSILTQVKLYTNIELSGEIYEDFDVIDACGLREYFQFGLSLFDELLEREIEAKMESNNPLQLFAKISNEAIDILRESGEHVNALLDKGDPNVISGQFNATFEKLIDKLPKITSKDVAKIIGELGKLHGTR